MKKPKKVLNVYTIVAYGSETPTNFGCYGSRDGQTNEHCDHANFNCPCKWCLMSIK